MRNRLGAKYLDFFPVLSHYFCLLFIPHFSPSFLPSLLLVPTETLQAACEPGPDSSSPWTGSVCQLIIHICLILLFLLLLPQATAVMKAFYPPLSNVTDKYQRKEGFLLDICCYLQVLSYNTKYKQNAWIFFSLLINYFVLSGAKMNSGSNKSL